MVEKSLSNRLTTAQDAFAILFVAYHPRLNLLGISTVHGNAPLSKCTVNALSVLEAIGKPTIPVFPGAPKPFCRKVRTAADIHGASGLAGTDLLPEPSRKPLTHCNAILEIKQSLSAQPKGTAYLVATGPLTNVALLFALFPSLAEHIAGLSIMGGAIGSHLDSDFTHISVSNTAGTLSAMTEIILYLASDENGGNRLFLIYICLATRR